MGQEGTAGSRAKDFFCQLKHLATLALFLGSVELLQIADMIPPVGERD